MHLTTYKKFFKRVWIGIKYMCGYKSKFGDWDTMIFKNEDLLKLRDFLNTKIK